MKITCVLFFLLCLQQVWTTDIQYDSCAYWTFSKGFGLPEYTERLMVNDVTIFYHDSSLGSKMPRPDWINTTAGKNEWIIIHDWSDHNRDNFIYAFVSATQQFNVTGSLTDQNIYQGSGCCSMYPNGTYTAFMTHAFNGKDFTSLDINTKTIVAAVSQAVPYKTQKEKNQNYMNTVTEYYKQTCLDRLNILKQAPDLLIRKVPEVRILEQQKKRAGSVTVTCHVTGFYPREVQVVWLGSDLQSVDEGVTEILPNGDGTYQTRKSVIVPEEDVGKQNYSCVVLHISIPNNITTVWVGGKASGIAVWISLVCISLLAFAFGFGVWRHCKTSGAVL